MPVSAGGESRKEDTFVLHTQSLASGDGCRAKSRNSSWADFSRGEQCMPVYVNEKKLLKINVLYWRVFWGK